jgi:hypothetical protein
MRIEYIHNFESKERMNGASMNMNGSDSRRRYVNVGDLLICQKLAQYIVDEHAFSATSPAANLHILPCNYKINRPLILIG